MTDVIEDLRARLSEVASTIDTPPGLVGAAFDSGRRRQLRRRWTAGMIGALTVVLVIVGGLAVAGVGRSGGTERVSIAQAPTLVTSGPGQQVAPGPVRCDRPTRAIPHFLGWRCALGVASAYYQGAIHEALEVGHADLGVKDLRARVLGYGPMPGVASGSAYVTAIEVWDAHHGDARIVIGVSPPRQSRPQVGEELNSADLQTSQPAYNTGFVRPDPGDSTATCNDDSASHDRGTAHCTDLFLVRPDVAALRLIRPDHALITVAAHNAFVGLPATSFAYDHHGDWTVEALNTNGQVIGTIGYANGFTTASLSTAHSQGPASHHLRNWLLGLALILAGAIIALAVYSIRRNRAVPLT
jgi:hypothetical protein